MKKIKKFTVIAVICGLLMPQLAISDDNVPKTIPFIVSVPATDPHLEKKGYVLEEESWVFSPEKAKEVRDKLIDGETEKKINESLQKSLTLEQDMGKIQQDKLEITSKQNDRLAKQLTAERTMTDWERFAYFGLGCLATGLVFYGATRLTK